MTEPAGADVNEADIRLDPPILFLHAGGLPLTAITDLFDSARCLGNPRDLFDLDGAMWTRMRSGSSHGFADYLSSEVDKARAEAVCFSALIDWRDMLWLQHRSAFQDLLRRPFRAVRLAFLDPVMQARRRLLLGQPEKPEPDFTALSRELIAVEEAEDIGDQFAQQHGLNMPRLWVEDLTRTDVPSLQGLLDRWSLICPKDTTLRPITPPDLEELEAVSAFRSEARKRHWAHALKPRTA